jgi:catechol 2,3-dioxygenase
MAIVVKCVGHVVLKVSDLASALAFYCGALGLQEVARRDFGDGTMVFLSTGLNHHDIGLVEVGPAARRPAPTDIGLYHVALKIGDSLDELRAARVHLQDKGVAIQWIADHNVSQSIYLADPDGNNVELYVDASPEIWRGDSSAVAHAVELEL